MLNSKAFWLNPHNSLIPHQAQSQFSLLFHLGKHAGGGLDRIFQKRSFSWMCCNPCLSGERAYYCVHTSQKSEFLCLFLDTCVAILKRRVSKWILIQVGCTGFHSLSAYSQINALFQWRAFCFVYFGSSKNVEFELCREMLKGDLSVLSFFVSCWWLRGKWR